jgi:hypothetical protein
MADRGISKHIGLAAAVATATLSWGALAGASTPFMGSQDPGGSAASFEGIVGVRAGIAKLSPGVSRPLDVVVPKGSASELVVNIVTVELKSVSAPNATGSRPCGMDDFEVVRAPSRPPAVRMLDRPVNQDGCKGAEVRYSFGLTATKAPGQ